MENWGTFALGMVILSTSAAAEPTPDHRALTSSISQDEKAVYEAALATWLDGKQRRQLVNEQLSAPPSNDDPEFRECTQGLKFSANSSGMQGQKSLSGVQFRRKEIELIDGSKWKPADPGEGIANGKSVEAAVREGFSKSLISFSQVAFSRDGNDALVKFSMVCGSLCGSGSTMLLHKSATGWAVLSRCGGWIS